MNTTFASSRGKERSSAILSKVVEGGRTQADVASIALATPVTAATAALGAASTMRRAARRLISRHPHACSHPPHRAFANQSGIEPIISRVLEFDEPRRETLSALYRVLPPTPVKIGQLAAAAQHAQKLPQAHLLNAQFIRRELSARRAYGLSMMLRAEEEGGPGLRALMGQSQIQELKKAYWSRLRLLLEHPQIRNGEDEAEFYSRMRTNFFAQEGETRLAAGQALATMQQRDEDDISEELEISSFLDSFFSQRVGLRFLVEHYLASKEPRKGFAGVIQMECSPVALMEELGERTRRVMHETFGASPAIIIHGCKGQTFSFVPSHIEFVVGELLNNAAKATVKHHLQSDAGRLTNLPPVKVIMAASPEQITIKVADTGGGIPRSQLKNVWAYRGKTTKRWGQGVGLGLPLARLYAKYFGGDMNAVPMEGHGTDCYVRFNRLADDNAEQLLKVPSFIQAARLTEMAAAMESEERPVQGKWRHAIRLFDAQQRRVSVASP